MNKNRLTMNTNLQFFAANEGLITTGDIDVTARKLILLHLLKETGKL